MKEQHPWHPGKGLCSIVLLTACVSCVLGQTDIGTILPPSDTSSEQQRPDLAGHPANSVTLADTAVDGYPVGSGPPRTSAAAGGSQRPAAPLPVAEGTVAQVAASGVPDRCIIAGSALFSSCAREIAAAQNRFNLTVDVLAPQNYTQLLSERGVTRDRAIQTLREILADPSKSCCNEACTFNQKLLCDCESTVLDVAVRFAGADVGFYALLIEHLAAGCGHKFYFNQTCPANRTVALIANGMGGSDGPISAIPGDCEAELAQTQQPESGGAAGSDPVVDRGVTAVDSNGRAVVQPPVETELQGSTGN